jgi:hypothetical protein
MARNRFCGPFDLGRAARNDVVRPAQPVPPLPLALGGRHGALSDWPSAHEIP